MSPDQLDKLVAGYQAGATVYQLAADFGIDRRTIAAQLKRHGVVLRSLSPASDEVEEMVRLYQSGQSLEAVGIRLGYVARTVERYLDRRGVRRRDTHGRSRS